ncbi:MAG: glycosyltransferase [Woeseia sp.]
MVNTRHSGEASESPTPVIVSVVIKTLNEERHIEKAICSALEAVRIVGGEVILADSGSSDATVAIARRHPVTIVRLRDVEERRCGIGPQLGYQVAGGRYVYILDGDMELDPAFLPHALKAMDENPRLGGVAGMVEECSEASYQFRGRQQRNAESVPGTVHALEMGGLYRREALEEVGYFSNRNLHAYEELELGLRLSAAGWEMHRLPVRGVRHRGRSEGSWSLLLGRWRSRYLDGAGELLRVSLGRPYFWRALSSVRHLVVALLIWAGFLAGIAMLLTTPVLLVLTLLAAGVLILIRYLRARSVSDALFGQVVWQVTAIAMIRGFFSGKVDPRGPIGYVRLDSDKGQEGGE